MSLRARIVAAIALVLVLGSALGLAFGGWHARQWLRAELTSARTSGELTVAAAFAELPRSPAPRAGLVQLIGAFDDNRHLQASLLAPDGRALATSTPAPSPAPPAWFGWMLHEHVAPVRLRAPNGFVVVLAPVYADDTAAVWAEFLNLGLVLALSCLGGAALVFVLVSRALAPLRAIGEVLPRIGAGDYGAEAPTWGPPELAALSRGVNEMAARLAAMRDRNRALENQILKLQDEERAEIARDLHDDIGPQLFAASVDAAMAARLIGADRNDEALGQVRSIQTAIAHIQRLVRDILGRLRPPPLAELGLSAAVLDLIGFWRARRPRIVFEARLLDDEAGLAEVVQETLYRLVQESLSNAMRHAEPAHVAVVVERRRGEIAAWVTNDGAAVPAAKIGLGLTGMAERVASAGGALEAGPQRAGGWRVMARLPLAPQARDEAA
ncbi:MAG TPA: histidine kinase [Caulobacteraceae bacterium]|nr:histidine kinase [Caulobacteraceae bacterium]